MLVKEWLSDMMSKLISAGSEGDSMKYLGEEYQGSKNSKCKDAEAGAHLV